MTAAANEILTDASLQVKASAGNPPKLAVVARPGGNMKPVIMKWTMLLLPPVLGLLLFVGLWAMVASSSPNLPGPTKTWLSAVQLFSDPFYQKGPNDQGIGWNILASLKRVGIGFGMAALVGIPLGFLIGRVAFLNGMLSPIISLLRPVSPLAWLPIGLLVFKAANPAAIWVIFISAIWPLIITTAVGVSRVPQDYTTSPRCSISHRGR